MNRTTHKILIVIILVVAIIAFFAGWTLTQKSEPQQENPTDLPASSVVIPMSIVTFKQDGTSSPSVSFEYPQFPSMSSDFNAMISSSTLSRLAEFKSEVSNNFAARNATDIRAEAAIPLGAYSFISSWEPAQINSRYISIVVRYDSYTGGANGNQDLQTFNYDVSNKRIVTLEDLFRTRTNYLQYISNTARQQLRESQMDASPGYEPGQMLLDGTESTLDNFSNFTFTDHAVTFYFPKYQVAPGSFGEQRVIISKPLDK